MSRISGNESGAPHVEHEETHEAEGAHEHSPVEKAVHTGHIAEKAVDGAKLGLDVFEHYKGASVLQNERAAEKAIRTARNAVRSKPASAAAEAARKSLPGLEAKAASAGMKAGMLEGAKHVAEFAEKAMPFVGAALGGVDQAMKTNAQTGAGKVLDVAGGAAIGAVTALAGAPVAIADLVTFGFVSTVEASSVRAVVSLGEAAVTGNTSGLEEFQKKSLAGENGIAFQGAAIVGDYIAGNDEPKKK